MTCLARRLAALMLALSCLLVAPFGGAAIAQSADQAADAAAAEIDYAEWERVAETVERMIAGGVASTSVFADQRAILSGWRQRFIAAEDGNVERVATIRGQIDALGEPPPEGETEPEAIAERRAELQAQLAEAQAPQLRANEALNRANGLIAEIDALLSERQTEELLQLEPSPLNPVNWAVALRALADLTAQVQSDLSSRARDPEVRARIADNGPLLLGLLLVGLLMILRARVLVALVGDRFLDGDGRRGRTALGFFVSLGQLFLPIFGFFLIVQAFAISDVLTATGEILLEAALVLIACIYASLWLAGRLFPTDDQRRAAFDATPSQRNVARWVIFLIGLLSGIGNLAEVVASLDIVPPAARGVLVVPIYVGLGLVYLRFARLLQRFRQSDAMAERGGFVLRVLALMTTALTIIAVVGPVLCLVGYVNAGEALMIPTTVTLFVLGVLLALNAVINDLYALVSRTSRDVAAEALLPVLVNFAMFLLALPVLAITWGVRPERLGDLYARALEGFALGNTRVTPGVILAVILVFAAGILITRLLQGALKSTILPRTRLDVGARNAVSAGVGYVGIALAGLIAVTSAGIDLTALGFVLGALSVGIGFGLQNVVSNFVSGIILLIERPISEGDWIEVNSNMGIVKQISVRSTVIETFDKTDVIVPNADFISGTVTNWTRGNTVGRVMVNVGVAYGTDTRRVQAILEEIARNHPDVAEFPEPGVDFMGFGADSMDFRVRVILNNISLLIKVQTELYHRIAERFREEDIEIPFAQRDVWLRNPETLAQAPGPVATDHGAPRVDDTDTDTNTSPDHDPSARPAS